ncbi:NAD+ diphosphatase [Rhizobiales bacterium GAS191]|jgi:NAD+ diphosphatase|nr:NAD+ diphosphatase [Rhizobiales bacterium GAS113]SEC36850.1 NAD+ diphosphatase [Rhizobiales bacterium GAS191]
MNDVSNGFAELSSRIGYGVNTIERLSERREDADFVAARAAEPSAATILIAGDTPILRRASEAKETMTALFPLPEIAARESTLERAFLGLDGARPVFATLIDGERAEPLKQAGNFAIDLRSIAVQGLVAAPELGLLAEAKALMNWHQRHRFCANCGTPSLVSVSGFRRDCPSCKTQHFPRTDPVAIMLPVRGEYCLLGRSARFASRVYSALAGFIEHGETLEAAVRREIKEESGIICGRVTYLASQPWPFPMSLMIGCHAQALSEEIVIDPEEIEDARWFTKAEAVSMLAGAHPEGLACPPPIAIAHWLIRAFVEQT